MGLIGYYGSDRFEVSSNNVLTFDQFTRDTAARFETLNRIGQKPLTEFIAPGLDTVSFSIKVSAMLGVGSPRQVMDHWKQLAAAGQPDVLVIGNKIMGTSGYWVVKSVNEAWEQFDGNGNVLVGTINLTFEEYMLT